MFPGGRENNQLYEIGVLNLTIFKYLQKQPPEVFYKKSCSEKCRNILRKTPALESLFNKVAGPCLQFY